jgi:hypothetical protein
MLETFSPTKSILALAKTDQEFPEFPAEFILPDVQRLLGILGLFKEPEIKFEEKFLVISEGNQRVRIVYAAPGLIVVPSEKEITFTPNVEFDIDENALRACTH